MQTAQRTTSTFHESQASISAWADETFGRAGVEASVAARALKEGVELMMALAVDLPVAKVAEEVADTAIVVTRLADRLGIHDLWAQPALAWQGDDAIPATPAACAALANDWLIKAYSYLMGDDPDAREHARAATALSFASLRSTAALLGRDLFVEIDRKMAINRAREWGLDGHGHGQHKPVAGDDPAP